MVSSGVSVPHHVALAGQKKSPCSPVPSPASHKHGNLHHFAGLRERLLKRLRLFTGAILLSLVLTLAPFFGPAAPQVEPPTAFWPQAWGQYSPFSSAPSDLNAGTPTSCKLTFGLVLSRHGSRFPTAPKTERYQRLITHLQTSVVTFGPGYGFIKNFNYSLGSDALTPYGEKELIESGTAFFRRYQSLADEADLFVRASGSDRVVLSAANFLHGFWRTRAIDFINPISQVLIIPEDDEFNNSLNHGACPNFEDALRHRIRPRENEIWKKIWANPILKRLNENLPGAALELDDVIFMMDLCPFNSVVAVNGTKSKFCSLFSGDEWQGYDYFRSLEKWYGYGQGHPLGPSQGIGYVNELIARLTNKSVEDRTTTNSTLDSSPETFPLGRKLYADFTHDNIMVSVYASLGLYNMTHDLPADRSLSPRETHGFSASWTVPFAARMYVEKMQCEHEEEELVRILVNDRVMALQGCVTDDLGRCKLGAFVDGLSFARSGGLWETCFRSDK